MNRRHCDNCDVVLGSVPTDPKTLQSVLRDGTIVFVETYIIHPVTQHRVELCAVCTANIINTATQPYMKRVMA